MVSSFASSSPSSSSSRCAERPLRRSGVRPALRLAFAVAAALAVGKASALVEDSTAIESDGRRVADGNSEGRQDTDEELSFSSLKSEEEGMSDGENLRSSLNVEHDRDVAVAMERGWWRLAQLIVEDANEKGIDVSTAVRSTGFAVKKNIDELIRSLEKKTPSIQKISPALQWAQSKEFVFLNIKFAFRWSSPGALEVEKEEIRSSDCCLHFHGFGKNSFAGRLYELDLELFGDILPEETEWSFGSVGKLAVTLKKKKAEQWERLAKSAEKKSNVHTWWEMKERLEEKQKAADAERDEALMKAREEKKEADKLRKEYEELKEKEIAEEARIAAQTKQAAQNKNVEGNEKSKDKDRGRSMFSWLKRKAFGDDDDDDGVASENEEKENDDVGRDGDDGDGDNGDGGDADDGDGDEDNGDGGDADDGDGDDGDDGDGDDGDGDDGDGDDGDGIDEMLLRMVDDGDRRGLPRKEPKREEF